jgi:hypothetical protein
MKADRYKSNDNYYTNINRTKIFVDSTNKRIKILDFNSISIQNLKRIIHYASKQHFGKIICNCDSDCFETFMNAGFHLEGKIDGFFKGKDAFCMSYFISSDRKICSNFAKKDLLVKSV